MYGYITKESVRVKHWSYIKNLYLKFRLKRPHLISKTQLSR